MRKIIGLYAMFICSFAFAQKSEIRGFVYNKKTGEPISYASVLISQTSIGTTTNADGYYILSKLTSGTYNIVASALGYDTVVIKIEINGSKVMTRNFFLLDKGIDLGEVNVSAEKQKKQNSRHVHFNGYHKGLALSDRFNKAFIINILVYFTSPVFDDDTPLPTHPPTFHDTTKAGHDPSHA